MVSLIACLGAGKGTWGHVSRLIDGQKWEFVFIITNDFGMEKFEKKENMEMIVIDDKKGVQDLIEDIKKSLDGKIFGDVAVNFISGGGKDHMALLAALLKLGVGVRLVVWTEDGIKEV